MKRPIAAAIASETFARAIVFRLRALAGPAACSQKLRSAGVGGRPASASRM